MIRGEQELEKILATTMAMITSLDPDAVLQTLVEKVRDLEGVMACAAFELDRHSSLLKIRCSSGMSIESVEAGYVSIGTGAVGSAFQSGDVVVVSNMESDPLFLPNWRPALKEGIRAIIAVPLVARDRLLGILAIYYPKPVSLENCDRATLLTLGNLAAMAMDNAMLFQERVRASRDLEALNDQLNERSEMLSRAMRVHESLVQKVLMGDGLDGLASSLAELAQRTVVIEDSHLNVLCLTGSNAASDGSPAQPVDAGLAPFVHDERVSDRIKHAKISRTAEFLPSIPDIGLRSARILAPVFVGEWLLGFVSILESENPFSRLDHVLSEQGAVAVALELMKRRVAFEVEQELRGDILQSLLAGKLDDLDEAMVTVAEKRFDLRALHRVLIVKPDRQDGPHDAHRSAGITTLLSRLYATVEGLIAGSYPKSMLAAQKDTLILLLGSDEELPDREVDGLAERIAASLDDMVGPTTVSVGIGGHCRHPRELRRSFGEATKALEVAAALGKRGLVIPFSRLGIYAILLHESNLAALRDFVERCLGPLIAHDRDRGSELVKTLSAYVRHNYRSEDTAHELFVHPNTVKYRLHKVEELSGLAIQDAEDMMNLRLALRVHELMG